MNRIFLRRGIVVAHFTSFLSGMILIPRWLNGNSAPIVTLLLLAIYLISTLVIFTFAYPYRVDGVKLRTPKVVDERQKIVRDGVLARSYWVTSLIVTALFLWFAAGTLAPALWHPTNLEDWTRVFWILVMITSVLPSAFIAWQEPEIPAAERELSIGGVK